jgi:hypothetical protein
MLVICFSNQPTMHSSMIRFSSIIWFVAILGFLLPAGTEAGGTTYEPTYPPRINPVPSEARAFYVEFRARNDGGFGHSYVTLGTIDTIDQVRQTVVVGFMPKSADDDHWSKIGLPVTGLVGVARSDLVRRPNIGFRVAISRATYFRVVNMIRRQRITWTTYEIVVRNCNNFVGQIASVVGLRTPLVTAQYPVRYVTELRALNSD